MKTITLTDGKKVEISDASYSAIEQAIGNAIAENKDSGFDAKNVYYSTSVGYKIVCDKRQMTIDSQNMLVVNGAFITGLTKCKWVETQRKYLKVGDVVIFSGSRENTKTFTPQLIVNISDNLHHIYNTQFFDEYGFIRYDSWNVCSYANDACFVARTE